MSAARARLPSQTAALAGIPAGIQAAGPWSGRRQLFVRFAGEAETATMYTAEALASELRRLTARSRYHSIVIAGRDPLAEAEYLATALADGAPLPVMLDHDGQRPDALASLLGRLALVQVSMNGTESDSVLEHAYASLAVAAGKQVTHALVIVPASETSDAVLLRIVERAGAASDQVGIIVHPTTESVGDPDRRWILWLERAAQVHGDVRVLPRMPAPTGMR
jgi:organic radical activating enzyme